MLKFDLQKCLLEIRKAETADLLDRVTAYRVGMEPDAISLIEQELQDRGVSQAELRARADLCMRTCLFDSDGTARVCSRCRRPAITEKWAWHRLWGILPIFPRHVLLCDEHTDRHERVEVFGEQ